MAVRRTRNPRRWGFVLGLTLLGFGCLAQALGLFDRIDRFGLDQHFRHFGTIDADSRIVLIDIDDNAIRALGWPWPRSYTADVVRTLHELGASSIILDLILSEPQEVRAANPPPSPLELDDSLSVLGDSQETSWVRDDAELVAAMRKAGNVHIGMFSHLAPPSLDIERLENDAFRLIAEGPEMDDADLRAALLAPRGWPTPAHLARYRLASVLERQFELTEEELATRVPRLDRGSIREQYAPAKRLAAERSARRFLETHPEADWPGFFASMLPGRPIDAISPDRETLLDAFRRELDIRAAIRKVEKFDLTAHEPTAHAYDLTVPHEAFSSVARAVGLVSFEHAPNDPVVRSVPLVAQARGALLLQLAFGAALDALGAEPRAWHLEPVRFAGGTGATLIHWVAPVRPNRWEDTFSHVPVTRILEIGHNRRAIGENAQRRTQANAELVKLRHKETPADYADYALLVRQRNEISLSLREVQPGPETEQTWSEMKSLFQRTEAIETEAFLWLERAWDLWKNEQPKTPDERKEREKIERLYQVHAEGRLEAKFVEIAERLEKRNEELLAELRAQIEGKICIVGSTASAEADLVATPAFASAPGIMVHANLINTVLQNRFPRLAPPAANLLITLTAGCVVLLVTCSRGPIMSLAVLVIVAAAVATIGAILFRSYDVFVAGPAAITTCAITWAGVTVRRQFTEERSRRHFQSALAQYTSPAIAARIADAANPRDLAPRAMNVTCFFSDLAGFTAVSERLGPARTRELLNPYLEEISRVLIAHNAIVNKFMGDGVFAFFNAAIWPCTDHPTQAADAAVAAVECLDALKTRLRSMGLPALEVRVGLATGEAFVGDYGSERKLDYTCIGDTVNVASRLERANKPLRTRILVNDGGARGAGDSFLFRPLGLVEVAGRTHPVPTVELMGKNAGASAEDRRLAELFARVIENYQARRWEACIETIRECRRVRPADGPAQCYERNVERIRSTEGGPGFSGAIRLE